MGLQEIGINAGNWVNSAQDRTRPVDNVVIATKGLQDRNTNIIAGMTV